MTGVQTCALPIFFSAYFFTQKCATGVGIFLTGVIISASEFPAKARPGEVAEPVLGSLAVYFLIALVTIAVVSIAFISRFPITRSDHEQRVAKLAAAATITAPPT